LDFVETLQSINVVDILVILFLFGMFVLGYIQGTIRRLLGIASIVFSFFLALTLNTFWLGEFLAKNWQQYPPEYSVMIGYLLIFVAGVVASTLVIQGTYDGVPNTDMVLTGSSNWASLSTANDELWFTVHGATVVHKYLDNFNFEWNSSRNSRNAYTTTYTDFRVPRLERQADGSLLKVYVTVRRPVTTVQPDPYRPGPAWEDD